MTDPLSLPPWQIAQAVENGSSREYVPPNAEAALRTFGWTYRNLGLLQRSDIALDFLVNSRLRRGDLDLLSSALHYYEDSMATSLALLGKLPNSAGLPIKLPKPIPLLRRLQEAMSQRRSCRQFTGDPTSLEKVATLLWAGVGTSGYATTTLSTGEQVEIRQRVTPSGGGLQPVQIWFLAINCTQLDTGVYVYDETTHSLIKNDGHESVNRFQTCFALSEETLSVSRATGVFCLIGRPWRTMRKYGPRGMRLMFMEGGYISEAIHLAASALGVGAVDCSAIYDDEAQDALRIDGTHETLVHAIVIGTPGATSHVPSEEI